MANHNFPNVYPEIKDLSQVVTANAITSCAYVGESEFGPINTPILVTNLKNYTDRFGALNPKYGYMGYSLAVAADTINSHYVVRVVDEDTAKYAAKFVALKGKSAKAYDYGYRVNEVKAAQEDSTAFFKNDTTVDTDDAFVIVANNPNNKVLKVSVADSTINTNKNILTLKQNKTTANVTLTLPQENLFEKGNKVVVTANEAEFYGTVAEVTPTYNFSASVINGGTGYHVGDEFTITGITTAENNAFTGKVISVSSTGEVQVVALNVTNDTKEQEGKTYATENTTDANATGLTIALNVQKFNNVVKVTFDKALTEDQVNNTWDEVRLLKLPEDDETTFSIAVYEVNGKVTTRVEYFQYLTLYNAKDVNGNSTFVEDVINSQSQYIQVFANVKSDDNPTFPEYPVPATITMEEMKGGTSGMSVTKAPNGSQYLVKGWDNFNDRTATTVTLLMNSGYAYESNLAYQSKMIEVAEKRRDCFALLDIPQTTASSSDRVLDWRKNVSGFNTYRASLTTPWVKTYDSVQGKSGFLMAPSAYVAKVMGTSRPWIAPAGPNRGVINSSIVSPINLTEAYDNTIGGTLYDAQLNCIVRNPGAGWAIWGQKTLQQKPSALDRINVARTVIYIETTLRDAARYHLFENNTAYERMQVTLQFNQFLDTILADGGIQRYQVVCDDSNNTPYIIANNTMVIDIYLWPTYTTEYIELNTIVMGPDANITVSSN
jgi:hypothetical protein